MQTGNHVTLREDGERGFLMVALLVGMAVAAVYMTAALPAWRQQTQREKEEELIFRGKQYARAIMLYQDKNRNANPPDVDVLVSQHFLRKKWKDPVTGEDFVPLGVGVGTPGSSSQTSTSGGSSGGARPQGSSGGGQPLSNQNPGVSGVRSKSDATSIKIYEQQQQYSLWPFNAAIYRARSGRTMPPQQGQNPGGPGAGGPRGGPQGAPGGGPQGGATGPRSGGSGPPPPPPPGAPPGPRIGGS